VLLVLLVVITLVLLALALIVTQLADPLFALSDWVVTLLVPSTLIVIKLEVAQSVALDTAYQLLLLKSKASFK